MALVLRLRAPLLSTTYNFLHCMGSVCSNSNSVSPANMAMGDNWKAASTVYDFGYVDIDGNPESMRKFEGHPLIIVNVASK